MPIPLAHYFTEERIRSLCGYWALATFVAWNPEPVFNPAPSACCRTCEAERTKRGLPK